MKQQLILFLTLGMAVSGCYRDNEEDLYPPAASCDSNGATYTSTVAPALQSGGCISCHSGPAPSGNIPLQTYTAVRVQAQNGKLWGSLSHSPGYSPMPKGGNKLSACALSKIKAWIDAGALNN